MKSGGSSSSGGGKTVNPNATVTGYGAASPFNPQYTSFLPENATTSANLGDPVRTEYGAPTPLLEQQQAAPMVAPTSSSSSGISDPMKRFLADLMARADRDKYLKGVNRESAGGGSAASGSFGGGGGSGGLW